MANKKNEKKKNQIDKLLSGEPREIMGIEIIIGNGSITGGFRFDKKIDEKMREWFGEKYEEIFNDFRKLGQKPSKDIGSRIAKLIIEDGLDGKVGEGESKKEIIDLLVKLGEALGANINKNNIEVLEVVPKDDDEDDDNEEDDE